MSTYVIGDVHACIDTLRELVRRLNPTDSDKFVFVGDLIDRGPDCVETVEFALSLPNVVVVRGNHEDKFLRWAFGQDKQRAAIKLWPGSDYEPLVRAGIHHKLVNTKWYHQEGQFIIIHAGIPPSFDIETQSSQRKNVLGFTRFVNKKGNPVSFGSEKPEDCFWDELYDGRYGFTIFGHQNVHPIRLRNHSLGIDTGCQSGRFLTAVELGQLDSALNAIARDEWAWPLQAIQPTQVPKCESRPDKYLDNKHEFL